MRVGVGPGGKTESGLFLDQFFTAVPMVKSARINSAYLKSFVAYCVFYYGAHVESQKRGRVISNARRGEHPEAISPGRTRSPELIRAMGRSLSLSSVSKML